MIASFLRAHPARTAGLVGLLLVASAVEGFGVLTLLPLLEVVVDGSPHADGPGRIVLVILARLGLEPELGVLLAAVLAAVLIKGLLRWVAMARVAATVARVARDLRLALMERLLAARWGWVEEQRAGDLATAVGRDAFWSAYAYQHACAALAWSLEAAVHAALILLVSWTLGSAALAVALLLALPAARFIRISRSAGEEQTGRTRALASGLLDVFGALRPIRAMSREDAYLPLLEEEARRLAAAEQRQVISAESLRALQEPLLVAALVPAVYLALEVVGVPFATLLLAIFLFHRLVVRVHRVQSELQTMAASNAAFRALHEQTEAAAREREDWPGRRPPPPLRDGIELRGVTFRRGPRATLDAVSVRFPAHGLTVVSGPSGAGKSTLLDLLAGLHRPDEGAILVDGVPLEAVDLGAWRRRTGYVPQETVLLRDTVLANVTLADAQVPLERVERALRRAEAGAFVAALPGGLHTVVGERGARLSGGERQRIALARALLRDPALLILDEPTSSLDPDTELAFCRTLRRLAAETTIIVATHRVSLDREADLVVELAAGEVHRVRHRAQPSLAAAPPS